MKQAAFEIGSAKQARVFDEFLEQFTRRQEASVVTHISLESVFEALRNHPEGGRIFTFFLEVQLQLALLNCDLNDVTRLIGSKNQPLPLADIDVFCRQVSVFRANSDYILRYRAIWDKVMAIVVLLRAPEEFQCFVKADSRKKAFSKIAKKQPGRIPTSLLDHVLETTAAFDQKYRTEEAHGTGSARKWSFAYFLEDGESPQADMFWAWNSLNAVVAKLGEAFRQIARDRGA